MKQAKCIAITCILTLATGCVGAGLIKNKTTSINYTELRKKYPDTHKTTHMPRTEQELIEKLGQPDKVIEIDKHTKIYRYLGDGSWKGVVLYLVIPVPLAAPLSKEEREYIFVNDQLHEFRHTYGWLQNIAVCSIDFKCGIQEEFTP